MIENNIIQNLGLEKIPKYGFGSWIRSIWDKWFSVEKAMEVKKCDTRTVGDDTFTQCISTKGSGSPKKNERLITFPVKAGETVKILCNNSGSGSRPLHLYNADTGEEVKVIAAGSYKEGDVHIDSTKIDVAGTYGVYSTSGGMYIYKIEINK